LTEIARFVGAVVALPLAGATDSQLPPGGDAILMLPTKARLPPDAASATVCAGGAVPPAGALKKSEFPPPGTVSDKLCGDVTVRFTGIANGLFPAPAEATLIWPV